MLDTAQVRKLGSLPVSATAPAGVNPRDGGRFETLQSHIGRLTDIHAGQSVEWPVVGQLAATILKEEGKDLAVAAWLAVALLHERGLDGLADGIHVLRELVETCWQDMSPPPTRLRARRNQMRWLLEHLNEALTESSSDQPPAMSASLHADMLADWEALDTAWQTHDDEAPAFFGITAVLRRLPVESADEPVAANPPAAEAVPALEPDRNVSAEAPVAQTAARAAAAPAVAVSVAPESGADTETAVAQGLGSLQPLVAWLAEEDPLTPFLFRLNRICAWAGLNACPAAKGKTTLLPSPGQALDAYERILQAGNPEAIIRFAESRLRAHPYWLDLNRVSHAALAGLNAHEAARTLAQETAHFLNRLPGLTELAFSDGRPFADAATRVWLDALLAPSFSQEAGEHDDVAVAAGAAERQAVDGKLGDALAQLQAEVHRAGSGRSRFRLRLAQCGLIHRFDTATDLRPMLAPLVEELEARQLASWEPELARQAFELAAGAELRHGGIGEPSTVPMLGRLSRVDLNAAWHLSQSTAD